MPHDGLDLLKSTRDWLASGRNLALATVIDTWGSAPVPVGGQMIIADEEAFHGSVSGGCVETDVIVAACEVLNSGIPRRLRFGVGNETAWAAGLPCGGNIEVYVQPLGGEAALHFVDELIGARSTRRSVLVETDLATGARTLHHGIERMSKPLASFYRSGRSGIVASADGAYFAHSLAPSPRLFVIGATHIAQALVAIAGTVGLAPTIIDPRESFVSQTRFGGTRIAHAWPKDALPEIGLDTNTAVIALAHVDHIDDEALSCALRSPARYIGALGSARNHAKRIDRLAQAGFSHDDIRRIRSPIGLDIGAVTPEEIALAVAAEVVMAFRGPKRQAAR
ncbi:MAG: XdhC family protein [Alphaproteobacteria bacterium]|nr:XdhC family protein [Alphaproteobacteria bacterium]